MSDVHNLVIERFLNNFGAPQVDDQEAFYEEYYRALTSTEETLLRAAMDYAIDHHPYPQRWPTVGECRIAVLTISARRGWKAPPEKGEPVTKEEAFKPTAESRARVDALMKARKEQGGGYSMVKEQAKWAAHCRARAEGRDRATPEELRAAERSVAGRSASERLPDVSRDAWEARFGKTPGYSLTATLAPTVTEDDL